MPRINSAVTVCYRAWDTSANAAKTGDAANHTLCYVADGAVGTPTNSPAEIDATNLPGWYKIALTAGENTGALMLLDGVSSTSDVVLWGVQWSNETNAAQISASATAADEVEAKIGNLDAAVSSRSDFDESTDQVIVATNNDKTGYALTAAYDAAKTAAQAGDSMALTAAAVDAILDEQVGDSTLTMRQVLRVFLAVLAGKTSGGGTTTITFRNAADSQDVVVTTVDASGNRTAVTITP